MRVGHSLDGGGGVPADSFIGSKIGQHSQIITGKVCTDGRRLGVDVGSLRESP
jgi:hypothetical protein